MFKDFKRLSFKHKNNKFLYYLRAYVGLYVVPAIIYQRKLRDKLSQMNAFDAAYVQQRVDYYNRLKDTRILSSGAQSIRDFKLGKKQKTYFFDTWEYIRYFNPNLKGLFLFGDITHVPNEPSIVKSRPIDGDITNAVVLKLDKIRHFLFVHDTKLFQDKKNMLVGRSKAQQPHRVRFLEMYFNHPLCNIGQVNTNANLQFLSNRMTISEHLNYKYILCQEGFDVASNLKWVMSSNSLAIMPKPKYETWFMEGTLIPDFHYVLIKDDFSDLIERMIYYNEHTAEALKIIENAHQYIRQFKNKKQEDLISLLVLKKYFEKTGQL